MKKKKRKLNKISLLSLIFVVFLVILSVTYLTTSALLTDKDVKQNAFKMGDLRATIEEKFDEDQPLVAGKTREKQVWVKNTGEQDSFVRVMLLPTMEKSLGTTMLSLPASFTGDEPTLAFALNDDWVLGEDGYFYYLTKVSAGEQTNEVLKEVTVRADHLPENLAADYVGAELMIEVKVEAVGTTEGAYQAAFWQGRTPTQTNLQTVHQKWQTQIIHEERK